MRIAVYDNLPAGGAARALHEYSTRLASRHTVDVYRVDDGRRGDEESVDRNRGRALEGGVDAVHRYPMEGSAAPRMWPALARVGGEVHRLTALQRQVAQEIDRRSYDVAFVHPCRVTQTPALLWMLETPTVYYMQEPRRITFEYELRPAPSSVGPLSSLRWTRDRIVDWQVRTVDNRAAQAADLILANSYYSVESIFRAYGREAVFCPLGADGDLFRLAPTEDREHRILSVGALVPHKGHELVIRSAAAVQASDRPAVGIAYNRMVPEWKIHLERLAQRSGVRLELHQAVPDERLAGLYRTSAATFCAARLEPFGLTVLESLCAGTPVIAVREGGYREIVVDGRNGILIDRDPEEGAKAIETVAKGGLGVGAAELRASVVPSWSWDRAAEALESRLTRFLADWPTIGKRSNP